MPENDNRVKFEKQQHESLSLAIEQVSHALRRLAEATSAHLGSDCYAHAEIARQLLAEKGFAFDLKVGAAAWRVGPGDADVVAHSPHVEGHLPPGGGIGMAYHTWLESPAWVLDFTTYQLRRKAHALDQLDGGKTHVDWCPPYLCIPHSHNRTLSEVAEALGPGVACYLGSPALSEVMKPGFVLDETELANARILLSNPNMQVIGVNSEATHR